MPVYSELRDKDEIQLGQRIWGYPGEREPSTRIPGLWVAKSYRMRTVD